VVGPAAARSERDSEIPPRVPLASDREPDGWLRVMYGQLPPESSGTERPPATAVDQDTPGDAVLGALSVVLVGVGLVITVALSPNL